MEYTYPSSGQRFQKLDRSGANGSREYRELESNAVIKYLGCFEWTCAVLNWRGVPCCSCGGLPLGVGKTIKCNVCGIMSNALHNNCPMTSSCVSENVVDL